MSILTHPPARWLLALVVRFFRAPAVRRLLLPLLFPGKHVDTRGRVLRERWEVGPPALGAQCVPGCDDPEVDWDGVHYCRVAVGRVTNLPATHRDDVRGAVVEVTQEQGEPRYVWLLGLDEQGRYANDGMRVSPAAARELAALLDTAFVLAGQPAGSRQAAGGAR